MDSLTVVHLNKNNSHKPVCRTAVLKSQGNGFQEQHVLSVTLFLYNNFKHNTHGSGFTTTSFGALNISQCLIQFHQHEKQKGRREKFPMD